MNRAVRRLVGAAVAAVSVAALAALSQLPYTPKPGPEALLRLSWRARGERVETCRELSEEEQRNLPQHMRREQVCEGTTAEYRLRVEIDGERRVDGPVQGSGEVQVRPLYVYREIAVPPGEHRLEVTLERLAQSRTEDGAEEEEEEDDHEDRDRRRAREAAVPRRLALERVVRLGSRQVLLVTYDSERRELVLRP
jgi:hypothetical protein